MKIAVVFGTRPEIIKLQSVIKKLDKKMEVLMIFTGQHKELGRQMLKEFGLNPKSYLEVMRDNQSLASLTARLHKKIGEVLGAFVPDCVVVQGDTASALVGGIESYYHKIPVAHIEAGLRTGNLYNPHPEEGNRKMLDVISSFKFAPTHLDLKNLKQEGLSKNSWKVGNTAIDTLLEYAPETSVEKKILVTLHRRESFGKPLLGVFHAIKMFALGNGDWEIIYPVHPNPNVKNDAFSVLKDIDNITLCNPMSYSDFIETMASCSFVVTDSGGIQEEAPSLEKPVLVIREETERMLAVKRGLAKLVGLDGNKVYKNITELAHNSKKREDMVGKNPFGDGHSSERIVNILCQNLK